MGKFSNLFGKDRDIVNEVNNTSTNMAGASVGQKLRVAAGGELESFDLAVETMVGAATSTTVSLSGVGNADAVNGLGGNTLPGPNLAGSFAAANVVGFQFQNNLSSDLTGFTDGQTFSSLTVTIDSTLASAPLNIAVTWNATWMYISGNNSDNNNSFPVIVALEDGSTFTDASSTYNWDNSYPGNQLSESNGSLSLGGAAGADCTTVTGDLKVTGLDTGFVRATSGELSSVDAPAARAALGLNTSTTIANNTVGNIIHSTLNAGVWTDQFTILTAGTNSDGSDSTFIGKTTGLIENQNKTPNPSTPAPADFRIWAGTAQQFDNITEVTDGSVLYIIRS